MEVDRTPGSIVPGARRATGAGRGRERHVVYLSRKRASISISGAQHPGTNLPHQPPDFLGTDTVAHHDRLNDRFVQQFIKCRFSRIHCSRLCFGPPRAY